MSRRQSRRWWAQLAGRRRWILSQLGLWVAVVVSLINAFTWNNSMVTALVWIVILAYWIRAGLEFRALVRRRHDKDEIYFLMKLLDYYTKPDQRQPSILLPEESHHDHPE